MAETDRRYMQRACDLARRGGGWVNPNPQVGCVIVKDGNVIGEGWHTRFGRLHAEREALADCARKGIDVTGSTVYVTLEPCDHTGKTPPCTDALIEAGVAKVIIGSADPNPEVSGRGIDHLKRAKIHVESGFMKDECDKLNAPFFHFITTGMPYTIAKYAMTLDGKIATSTGLSKWVTGSAARHRVHEDRSRYAAVMVGIKTVFADDPALTARLDEIDAEGQCVTPHQPAHIVVDSKLSIPLDCKIVSGAEEFPTYVLACSDPNGRLSALEKRGVHVIFVAADENGHVDLEQGLRSLGAEGIDSVIVEGGKTLLGSLFDRGLVNYVQAYIAMKIFGGDDALSPIGGCGVEAPSAAYMLDRVSLTKLGDDILIEGALRR